MLAYYPRAAQGDSVAFEALLGSVVGLVYSLAKKYSKCSWEFDELVEAGYMGFVRGIRNGRWKPNRGAWSTYMTFCIQGPMLLLKSQRMDRDVVRIPQTRFYGRYREKFGDPPSTESMYFNEDALSIPSRVEQDAEEAEELVRIQGAMRRLPQRQCYILEQCVVYSRTLESVGNELAISKERVRQIKREAIARVRDMLFMGKE